MRRHVIRVSCDPAGSGLEELAGFCDSGQVVPLIDRKCPLDQTADAGRHVEGHHAWGKIVVPVGGFEGPGGPSKERQ